MPRYICPDQLDCPVSQSTNVPIADSKTGAPLPALVFPQVLTATGQLYSTLAAFLAGIRSTVPAGVDVSLGADGVSITFVHSQFWTPPAAVGVWPQTAVQVVKQGSNENLCPFIGPVIGPQGATFNSRAALIAAVDNLDATAYYWEGSGAACPVIVAYHPTAPTPSNIAVAGVTTTSTLKLVEQSTGAQIACPARMPIYLAADGSKHQSLTSLAQRVATLLGAGYSNVQVGNDNCSLTVQHDSFTPKPADVQVNATASVIIPVRLNGTTVCPPTFPVRLASAPNGTQYTTMAGLAAGFQATLPARFEVTPFDACQMTVVYPAVATPPAAVDIVTKAWRQATFTTVRSRESQGPGDATATVPNQNTHYGNNLLSPSTYWPQYGAFNYQGIYSATAWLIGLKDKATGQAVTGTVFRVRATFSPTGEIYTALKNGASGSNFIAPSNRGGGTSATGAGYSSSNVTAVPNQTTTVTWDIPAGVSPANITLFIQVLAFNRSLLLASVEYEA